MGILGMTSLFGYLFHIVRDVVLRMFSKINKTENFTPGFFCVLHTFGRDLKWKPHIHYGKLNIMTREAE